MSEAWGLVTSDDEDPVLAAIGLVHEALNPMLLADGHTQDEADQMLARITHDLCAAAKRAAPHEAGDVARLFAHRCIVGYGNGGHRTH
jgi:hypothetical protein